jgi:hypothetical protein
VVSVTGLCVHGDKPDASISASVEHQHLNKKKNKSYTSQSHYFEKYSLKLVKTLNCEGHVVAFADNLKVFTVFCLERQ